MKKTFNWGTPRFPHLSQPPPLIEIVVALVSLISIMVLLGWALDIELLKQGYPGCPTTMKPNTAIGLLFSGISLGLTKAERKSHSHHIYKRVQLIGISCSIAVVLLIGGLTLSQYLGNWDLGIDQWLFTDSEALASHNPYPGRMGITTALSFLFFGNALLISRQKNRISIWIAQLLACLTILLASCALIGYLYGVDQFYRFVVSATAIASHTAIAFLLLSAGLLSLHRDEGLMRPLSSTWAGSLMAQRLLPQVIALPLVLGWIDLRISKFGAYDFSFGLTLFVLVTIVLLVLLIWLNAKHLNQLDRERQHTTIALRKSQEQLSAIIDNSSTVIYLKDINGHYLLVNHHYERLTHHHRDQVIGKTDFDLFPPDKAAQFWANDQQVLTHGQPIQYEETIPLPDGNRTYIAAKFPLYDSQGIVYAVCGISTDITELKHTQEALQQSHQSLQMINQELKRSIQAKDSFLRMLGHELRTPLNPILGMAEALQDEVLGTLNERQNRAVSKIIQNGRSLLNLINDILTLVDLQAGKIQLDRHAVSIQALCKSSLAAVESQAEAKSIQLHCHIAASIGIIHLDIERMQQVLIHLLKNAVKFTPNQGSITMEAEMISSEEALSFTIPCTLSCQSILQISIHDTGIGIAPEQQEQIFQSFVQVDDQISRRYPGIGLGLAISKRLVELQGGSITVKSQLNLGSCFIVSIPVAEKFQ